MQQDLGQLHAEETFHLGAFDLFDQVGEQCDRLSLVFDKPIKVIQDERGGANLTAGGFSPAVGQIETSDVEFQLGPIDLKMPEMDFKSVFVVVVIILVVIVFRYFWCPRCGYFDILCLGEFGGASVCDDKR